MIRNVLTLIIASLTLTSPAQDLLLTAVYDGPLTGGTPKGVELFVINDIADLSLYGLGSANNGGPTDSVEFTFPNIAVDAGTFLYVTTDSMNFNEFFGFAADFIDGGGATLINGDDVIELFFNGSVIDVFGVLGVDGTGEDWEYLDGWAYRKDDTGPGGSTFTISEWDFSGPDALDGETSNGTAATPVPIGTYQRGVPQAAFDQNQFTNNIYPNPSRNGIYTVSLAGKNRSLKAQVYNLVGDVVWRGSIPAGQHQLLIDIGDRVNGTYFLQISDNYNNKESHKLLKW